MSKHNPYFLENHKNHLKDSPSSPCSLNATAEGLLDLSHNTNAFAEHLTKDLLASTPYPFQDYPDSNCTELRKTIAIHEQVSAGNVFVGSGSSELIWLSIQALKPYKVVFIGSVFAEFVAACLAFNIPYETIETSPEHEFACTPQELRKIWDSNADLAVICTPNNPGGITYPNIQEIIGLLKVPRIIVDNTFKEFLWGSRDYEINTWKNYQKAAMPGTSIFTINSFTKFFAALGIRLGYLLGNEAQLKKIKAAYPPWTISQHTQNMGLNFLLNINSYRETIPQIIKAGESTAIQLRQLEIFNPDYVFQGVNFITAGLSKGLKSEQICHNLRKNDVCIRNCDDIQGMPQNFIRFQICPKNQMQRLLDLFSWLEKTGG